MSWSTRTLLGASALLLLPALGGVGPSARAEEPQVTDDKAPVTVRLSASGPRAAQVGLYSVSNEMDGRAGWSSLPGDEWTLRCQVPCDRALPGGLLYSVRGPGVVPSGDFRLVKEGQDGGAVQIQVSPSSVTTRRAGLALGLAGIPVLIAGVAVLVAGSQVQDDPSLSPEESARRADERYNLYLGGGVTLGVGAAMLIGGMVVLGRARTEVRLSNGERLARLGPRGPYLTLRGLAF